MEAKQTHPMQLLLPLSEVQVAPLPESIRREVVSVVATLLCQAAQKPRRIQATRVLEKEVEHASEAT